jgi:hypothetical protein
MDRIRLRLFELASVLVTFVIFTSLVGCGLMSVMLYNMNPDDIPAEFNNLRGKRVAVVCRSVRELQFTDSTVPRDLMREVNRLLAAKVKKIDLIDERDVSQWTDENTWQKFTEIGKALKADIVVGIELERFTLYQGPTLFQGNATVRVVVYDMQDGGKQVYEKSLPRVLYPPHTPISSADKSEGEFRVQFLGVLAEQISRHFYAHDSRVDFATDAAL